MAGGISVKFSATDSGFTSTVNRVNSSMRGMDDNARRLNGSVKSSFAGMAKAGAGIAAGFASIQVAIGAISGAARSMNQSIQSASSLSETISKVGVIFGDGAKQIEAFAKTADFTLGQSKQQAMDAAAMFAILGKSAGLGGNELVKFSTDLTTLASDISSFYDIKDIDEVITAIGSAMRGESEPIRRFGVLLDDATLRAQAMKMGLIETTKQALTPQQKALAAYNEILRQTGDAQGDFARTSGGLAGQQKILAAQFENLKAQIGQELLPAMTDFVSALNKMDIKGITADTISFAKATSDLAQSVAEYVKQSAMGQKLGLFGKAIGMGVENIGRVKSALTLEERITPALETPWSKDPADLSQYNEGLMVPPAWAMAEKTTRELSDWLKKLPDSPEQVATGVPGMDDITGMVHGMIGNEFADALEKSMLMRDNFDFMADNGGKIADSLGVAAEKINSYSDNLWDAINAAKDQDKIDPGGRIKARADEALGKGQFGVAERAGNRLDRAEQEKRIQDMFGGGGKLKKSLADIAKGEGLDTKGKSSRDIRKELDALAKKRQEEMKPGKQGKAKGEIAPEKPGPDPMMKIAQAVELIQKLVAKIEPKLPTAALGA